MAGDAWGGGAAGQLDNFELTPEPATALVLAVGVVPLLWRRRKAK